MDEKDILARYLRAAREGLIWKTEGGWPTHVAKLQGVARKNRVTVYYLLADHFGKLGLFKK